MLLRRCWGTGRETLTIVARLSRPAIYSSPESCKNQSTTEKKSAKAVGEEEERNGSRWGWVAARVSVNSVTVLDHSFIPESHEGESMLSSFNCRRPATCAPSSRRNIRTRVSRTRGCAHAAGRGPLPVLHVAVGERKARGDHACKNTRAIHQRQVKACITGNDVLCVRGGESGQKIL
jgi:hypothetical protein